DDNELLEEPGRRPRWPREVVRMPMTTSNAPVFFTSAEEHAVAAGRVGVPTNGLVPEIAGEQDGLQDRDRHSPEEPKVDLGRGHNRRRRSADPSLRQLLDHRRAGQFVLQPPRAVWYGLLREDQRFHEVLRGLGVSCRRAPPRVYLPLGSRLFSYSPKVGRVE